eukprot:NODE_3593_length_948_cov_421.235818_g3302_i0.p1 GENE.NODE_3593_length_948_cov_421.235818_g3302_i0~~NODE_3593_length_948_cov_421.235818_g3302_i0.p1  ORF type:complete len:232 (+),score=36.81 NODE_3593_length_948_cov_421.235818_g3302_i0:84-779(+)
MLLLSFAIGLFLALAHAEPLLPYSTTGISSNDYLRAHNYFRCKHGSPPVVWSSGAAWRARNWVVTLDQNLVHSSTSDGENLGYWSRRSNFAFEMVKYWYDELYDYGYDFKNPGFGPAGHFTQVVWASTKEIGCATAGTWNRGAKWYTVCNYRNTAGNFDGKYAQNVKPLVAGASCSKLLEDSVESGAGHTVRLLYFLAPLAIFGSVVAVLIVVIRLRNRPAARNVEVELLQ